MPYWFAIHLGNVLARTLLLVTYNGIHVEMENIEWGPGGGAPRKILLATPFRLLENAFSASSSIPGFLEN